MIQKLTSDERTQQLAKLNRWESLAERDAIRRRFEFADFNEAFGFMTRVAIKAQEMDHHPEWFNVYHKVVVDLVTHSAGGITARDVELARRMSEIAARRAPLR